MGQSGYGGVLSSRIKVDVRSSATGSPPPPSRVCLGRRLVLNFSEGLVGGGTTLEVTDVEEALLSPGFASVSPALNLAPRCGPRGGFLSAVFWLDASVTPLESALAPELAGGSVFLFLGF